jgi:hypothetical protein
MLTVNVLFTAPSLVTNSAQATSLGADAVPTNNRATVAVTVAIVGVFALEPTELVVATGERVQLALEWTVPGPSWRELKDLQLRIRDADGTVLAVRLVEGTPLLLALYDDETGRFGPAKAPGSAAVLSSRTAKVYLSGTSVTTDGPTDPGVVMTLDVSFKRRAADRTYVVEVKASDDFGTTQDWRPAGTVTVLDRGDRGDNDD